MDMIRDISQFMIGGSLCLMGSVFVIEGSLTLLGYAVFAPMALGGLGLCISSLKKIFPELGATGEVYAA